MTFQADEQSVQNAAPVELYKFIGTYNTYRLTNHGRSLTNTDGTYDPAFAVSRTDAEEGTQEDDDISIDIEIDVSHPMVAEYAIEQPPPDLRLQIFRAHINDLNDTFLVWDGNVISWGLNGRVARLRVPSIFAFLFDAPVPRTKYQAPCNHILGDARCGVDLSLPENSADTSIVSINGTEIVVAANPFPDGELNAGQIIATNERRMVTASAGTTLTIASRFSSAVVGGELVTLRRGCDHALAGDCINRFNNAINFGGHPLVPNRNPFSSRL